MPLDPFFDTMLKELAALGGPAMTDVPPTEARKMYQAMQTAALVEPVHSIEDKMAGKVPIRIFRASGERTPCVVYYHGGGWVIGDLDTHASFCTQLANATGYTIISVDYRLAPEFPFPAPLDDCYNALCWVKENAGSVNIDAARIAVAGDSAGANLAAAVCLKAKQEGNTAIAFQLLIYPVTDFSFDTPSYTENAEGYMLTREGMHWFWNHYIGHDKALASDPLASPLKASDFSDLPPACVLTAEFDPLRDEGMAYAAALEQAGVDVTSRCFDGMIHGFFDMKDKIQGARDAMDFATRALKKALA